MSAIVSLRQRILIFTFVENPAHVTLLNSLLFILKSHTKRHHHGLIERFISTVHRRVEILDDLARFPENNLIGKIYPHMVPR